ncbi:hypothetical protein Ahy_B05g075640 isoform B [Arachis hypogaea]|uniref:Uncharacterized protein n=1 Tax=Arachis hypogaea TaxID=3818 RepID=A0A444Z1P0_ARAHY|nr:hypothetical protein Ahy_B05g075640 isoform B [Arachis hypogaea]
MISSGGILLRRQSRPSSYCVVRFFSHKLARVSEEGIVETFHNDDDEALDAAENGVVGTASVVLAGLVATLKLACKLKLGDLKGALFDSKFALCGEDNNVKALFRQGQHSSSVIPA